MTTWKPEILTVSGNTFNFDKPESSTYTVEDIAHALSHICRFCGHTKKFYSVAQHSVMVSYLVPADLAMIGLMHDSSEAFLGDISSPLKQMLPQYKEIELKVEAAIFKKFGLLYPMPAEIKKADLTMLASEMKYLMPKVVKSGMLKGISPLSIEIKPWSFAKAKREFIKRYCELKGE